MARQCTLYSGPYNTQTIGVPPSPSSRAFACQSTGQVAQAGIAGNEPTSFPQVVGNPTEMFGPHPFLAFLEMRSGFCLWRVCRGGGIRGEMESSVGQTTKQDEDEERIRMQARCDMIWYDMI